MPTINTINTINTIRHALAGLIATIALPIVMGTTGANAAIVKRYPPAPHHPSKPHHPSPSKPVTGPTKPKPPAPKPSAPKPSVPRTVPPKPQAGNPSKITKAVTTVNPLQKRYLKHDITGDGRDETFCNWFLMDVSKALGYPRAIPSNGQPRGAGWSDNPLKPLSANELNKHFRTSPDWQPVSRSEAARRANNGEFVVGSLIAAGHGHVAVVVPGSTAKNIRVAQAGSTNSVNMPADNGFEYYVYTGK